MANQTSAIFQHLVSKLNKLEKIEKEIQIIKWEILKFLIKQKKKSVVKETAGILGRSFPSGVKYQRKIRESWNQRFSKLNL